MEELPAGAALAALACAVAGDAMADAVDAAELVGVEVDQCADPFAPVADELAGRIEGGEPAEAETAQCDADSGARRGKLAGDRRA